LEVRLSTIDRIGIRRVAVERATVISGQSLSRARSGQYLRLTICGLKAQTVKNKLNCRDRLRLFYASMTSCTSLDEHHSAAQIEEITVG
jgi:hypothetical protein